MRYAILSLALLTGCAHGHAVMHQRVNHERHVSREFHGPQVGPVSIGDEEHLKIHTTYVLDTIYQRINRNDSQRAGRVYISADWFRQQGLTEDEKNKVFHVLEQDGYSCDVNQHYNTCWNRYQDDILITW